MAKKSQPPHLVALHKDIVRWLDGNQSPGYNKVNAISTHIFIANWDHAVDLAVLKEHSIKAVLTIENKPFPEDKQKALDKKGISYLFLELDDMPSENIMKPMKVQGKEITLAEYAYYYILQHVSQKQNVMVHCAAGVSRSATFVAYYYLRRLYELSFKKDMIETLNLLSQQQYYIKKILEFIKLHRPAINPNPGFVAQLIQIEHNAKIMFTRLIGEEAQKIREQANKDLKEGEDLLPVFEEPSQPNLEVDIRTVFYKPGEPETEIPTTPKTPKLQYDKLKDLPALIQEVCAI